MEILDEDIKKKTTKAQFSFILSSTDKSKFKL